MKKVICMLLTLIICLFSVSTLTACGGEKQEFINVYNWGEYISDGSEDYLDVISMFEEKYNIKVNYTTYETNEELYSILSTTNSNYDVIIPSDYMVEKLIKEGLVQKINKKNIPNRNHLMNNFKTTSFDPKGEYCVPYMWGVVGMVYNTKMMDYKPNSWTDLWNEDLKGGILQFNNSRDAYAIALQLCGVDPNSFTIQDVDNASEMLLKQKPFLKKYVMDQVFTEMENNQATIAPYYMGDIVVMMDNNPNLDCALPKEGSNLYVDSMCIPTCAQNKEGAEKFINFMTDPEIAVANADYVGYSTPVQGAYELLDEETRNNKYIYPDNDYLEKCYTFRDLDSDVYVYMQEEFIKVMAK